MNFRGAAKGLDQALYYILIGILALYSLMYLFVFIINWECWFFGMKMDGGDAGIILFTYFAVSLFLASLLLKYPRRMTLTALLSVIFFSFAFLDSSVTVRELSDGANSFTFFMAALVIIPLVVLIGHLIAARFYDAEEGPGNNEKEKGFSLTLKDESGGYSTKSLLILAVIAIVFYLVFGILVMIPALVLLVVLFVKKITEKENDQENGGGTGSEFNISGVQLLLIMAVLMALFLLTMIVMPVLYVMLTH